MKTRAERRKTDFKKAVRKQNICEHNIGDLPYDNLHQYSKNKIHCSCPYCNTKTRNKGSRRYKSGNYNPAVHYRASDLRRVIEMDEDLREAGYFAPRHKRNRYS